MIRVGFSHGHVFLSKIIEWMTGSKASHSYIVFDVVDQQIVLQADIHGVCCQHYDNFKKDETIVAEYELLITPEQKDALLSFGLKKLLLPYNYFAIIGFIWVVINKKFGRKINQPFNVKNSYFCSELVIAALQAGMFPLSHTLDMATTSPEDIIQFLDAHPGASKLVTGLPNQ